MSQEMLAIELKTRVTFLPFPHTNSENT